MKITYLLIVIATILLTTSCSKKQTGSESLIPNDAKLVLTINAKQLADKMAASGFNADDLQNSLIDSTFAPVKSFSKYIGKSGVDWSQPIVIAISPLDNLKAIGTNYGLARVIIAINNKDSLLKSLDMDKEDLEMGAISYYIKNDEETAMGFNNKYMVVVAPFDMKNLDSDNIGNVLPVKNNSTLTNDAKKDLIKKTLQGYGNKSILSNSDYNKTPSAKNDIKIWYDYAYFANNNGTGTVSRVERATQLFKDLIKGSSNTTILNFENGKVNATNQWYFSKETANVIKNSPTQTIDLSLLQNFPGKNLNGVAGFSIAPSLIQDIVKYIKIDGIFNLAIAETKLSPDDVFGAITGEVLFVLSDMTATQLSTNAANNPNVGIIIKIKDKAKFDKLLTQPFVAQKIKQEGAIYKVVIDNEEKPLFMAMNNTVAIISTTQKVAEDYISGTTKNTFDAATLANLKGKSAGYYFNFGSLGTLPTSLKIPGLTSGIVSTVANNMLQMFNDTYMTSGNFKDNYIETNGVLNMNSNKQNSLTYMIRNGYKNFMMVQNENKKLRPRNASEIDLSDIPSGFEDDTELPIKVK